MPGFRSVRFGNVIGSRGSVLHTFRIQALHHEHVVVRGQQTTRFFMTGGEAASLVLSTFVQHQPGGTYVFDMGEPVQILQLANAVVDDLVSAATIRLEDLQKGEVEHERLFHELERPESTAVDGVHRVEPIPLELGELEFLLPEIKVMASLNPAEARSLLKTLLLHKSTS